MSNKSRLYLTVMFLPYPCISPHMWCLRQFNHSRYRHSFRFQSTSLCQLSSLWLAIKVRFQHIQNSVARIVLQQPSLSSLDTLQQLHWLPVIWQIQFKLSSLTYKVLHTSTPSYLSEHLHQYVPSCTLRSCAELLDSCTNLHFGSRSFHITAPTVYTSHPCTFRLS